MSAIEWTKDRNAFLSAQKAVADAARQRLALQILCKTDLDTLMQLDEPGKSQMCVRLKRLIERERLKGSKGHWGYDLNRHIGLKQALNTLRASMPAQNSG